MYRLWQTLFMCVVTASNYLLTFACCTNNVFSSSATKHRKQTPKDWQIAYRIHCSKTAMLCMQHTNTARFPIQIHFRDCFDANCHTYIYVYSEKPLKLILSKLRMNRFLCVVANTKVKVIIFYTVVKIICAIVIMSIFAQHGAT